MARKGKLKDSPENEQRRPIRIKRYGYLFLIVCEDQKTEKVYFEGFSHSMQRRIQSTCCPIFIRHPQRPAAYLSV